MINKSKCICKCKCFTEHEWKLESQYKETDLWNGSTRILRVYLCTRCLETKEVRV